MLWDYVVQIQKPSSRLLITLSTQSLPSSQIQHLNYLLMTSNTVVFLTPLVWPSESMMGVYPVIRKWHLGVGTREATRPTKSLFMYPGYLRVVVEADITVETREFNWLTVGFEILRRSTAIRFKAVLSSTTTASAFNVNLFKVSRELYGCTTTSGELSQLGNTEYVYHHIEHQR